MKSLFIGCLFLVTYAKGQSENKPGLCSKDTTFVNGTTVTSQSCCPGWRPASPSRPQVCIPVCAKPCRLGVCSAPNTCTCNRGYRPDPADRYHCVADCPTQCEHARCTAPDFCVCDRGYVRDPQNRHRCLPHCGKPCRNADCTAPDTCTCRPEYYAPDSRAPNLCAKLCARHCDNAECVAKDTCQCHEGYIQDVNNKFSCKRKCSKECSNGECTGLEICTCNEGFEVSMDDPFLCEKIALTTTNLLDIEEADFTSNIVENDETSPADMREPFCSPACINATCAAHNSCTCFEGYEPESQFACKPTCHPACSNAHCTAPDVCWCSENHTPHPINKHECIPNCPKECSTTTGCEIDQPCQCAPGYTVSSTGSTTISCVPVCPLGCPVHASCTSPDVCTCTTGYTMTEAECKPTCSEPCVNADCVEPDVCSCHVGYTATAVATQCDPVCSEPCLNGYCSAPDVCACDAGYHLNRSDHFRCNPTCAQLCRRGSCTAPDECTCDVGYMLDTSDKYRCDPVCGALPENSICLAPDTVSCKAGFVLVDNVACEALCEYDVNTTLCTSPDPDVASVCESRFRYDNNTSRCQPVCHPPCDAHAQCNNVNQCICNNDYRQSENDTGCEPICEPDCESGAQCVAPGQCQCDVTAGLKLAPDGYFCVEDDSDHDDEDVSTDIPDEITTINLKALYIGYGAIGAVALAGVILYVYKKMHTPPPINNNGIAYDGTANAIFILPPVAPQELQDEIALTQLNTDTLSHK